ncbi:MAG: hypothetical protein ACLVD8_10985 [Enterocloster sp.]|uniref:hypothetical protein n=1 Tax=Enterocloster sp. TaxID=2719315 RepID=UPI00399BB569
MKLRGRDCVQDCEAEMAARNNQECSRRTVRKVARTAREAAMWAVGHIPLSGDVVEI